MSELQLNTVKARIAADAEERIRAFTDTTETAFSPMLKDYLEHGARGELTDILTTTVLADVLAQHEARLGRLEGREDSV